MVIRFISLESTLALSCFNWSVPAELENWHLKVLDMMNYARVRDAADDDEGGTLLDLTTQWMQFIGLFMLFCLIEWPLANYY